MNGSNLFDTIHRGKAEVLIDSYNMSESNLLWKIFPECRDFLSRDNTQDLYIFNTGYLFNPKYIISIVNYDGFIYSPIFDFFAKNQDIRVVAISKRASKENDFLKKFKKIFCHRVEIYTV